MDTGRTKGFADLVPYEPLKKPEGHAQHPNVARALAAGAEHELLRATPTRSIERDPRSPARWI